jgi:hypothetical protein
MRVPTLPREVRICQGQSETGVFIDADVIRSVNPGASTGSLETMKGPNSFVCVQHSGHLLRVKEGIQCDLDGKACMWYPSKILSEVF